MCKSLLKNIKKESWKIVYYDYEKQNKNWEKVEKKFYIKAMSREKLI